MRTEGPILVALDGSADSERVLPYAGALARGLGADVVLVSVLEYRAGDMEATFPAIAAELRATEQSHLTAALEAAAARIGEGVSVAREVRSGDPSEEIAAAARASDARAIAIATHGRSGIGRWAYGSTTGRLLHDSRTPILAVGPHVPGRGESVAYRHVMVPLDGSPLSEDALPVAQILARALGARISLVRVVQWAVQAYPFTPPSPYLPQIDEEIEKAARDYLARQTRRLSEAGNAEAFVVRGSAADGIIDFAEQRAVDLIVMTTHARAGVARAALGSAADRALQAPAPVLLIRPADKGQRDE